MARSLRPLSLFALLLFAVVQTPAVLRAADFPTIKALGTDYVSVADFARHFGLTVTRLADPRSVRLAGAGTSLTLTADRVEATLNQLTIYLGEPVFNREGRLYLGAGDARELFAPILRPAALPRPARPLRTIVIDAGHGGRDPGNQNLRLKLNEKTFALDVARRLERLLKAQGFRVLLTRTQDRFVELDDRPAFANRHRADLFVSVHFNGFSRPDVNGAETYVMTPHRLPSTPQAERDPRMAATSYPSNRYDKWNALLGYQVHRALVGGLRPNDRGLKRFRYSVLRSIECPAVLVEAGFLSHDPEGRKIATPAYRQKIAESIAAGLRAYAAVHHRATTPRSR